MKDITRIAMASPRNPEQPFSVGYFYGGLAESFIQFLECFQLLASSQEWETQKKLRMFPGYLRDVSLQAYLGLLRETRKDWEALKVAFTTIFMPPEHIHLAQGAFLGCTQHPTE